MDLYKFCTNTVQHLIVKIVLFLALRLEIHCKIVELAGVILSISMWMKINFFSLEGSSAAAGRLELDTPAAFSCLELDTPLFDIAETCSLSTSPVLRLLPPVVVL